MSDTQQKILDTAQALLQRRGFNGFSYADIAGAVGIKTATIHYYFKSKEDLGLALVDDYIRRIQAGLQAVDESGPAPADALAAYADVFRGALQDDRLCLCGMLSAEALSLPPRLIGAFQPFFDMSVAWLVGHLNRGAADGSLKFKGSAETRARYFVALLEGAMLLHGPGHPANSKNLQGFDQLVAAFLADISV